MQGSLQSERTDCRMNPSGIPRSPMYIVLWSGFPNVGEPTSGRGTLRIRPIKMSDEGCDRGVIPIKSSRTLVPRVEIWIQYQQRYDLLV